jgi:hypothetical protein
MAAGAAADPAVRAVPARACPTAPAFRELVAAGATYPAAAPGAAERPRWELEPITAALPGNPNEERLVPAIDRR